MSSPIPVSKSPVPAIVNRDLCAVCKTAGDLLLCDSCPRSYHEQCASKSMEAVIKEAVSKRVKYDRNGEEEDEWICPHCILARGTGPKIPHASTFPLGVIEKQALGANVSIARVLQYFEVCLTALVFDKVVDYTIGYFRDLSQGQVGAPRATISLKVATYMQGLSNLVGQDTLLNALRSSEQNAALAIGLNTMAGPQPCYRQGCRAFRKFRVLRTRCFFCGDYSLDPITKLPRTDLSEFVPGNMVNDLKFHKKKDISEDRLVVAERGLRYFEQVALEPKMQGVGDIMFLAFKLWGSLRSTQLERAARLVVESLTEIFIEKSEDMLQDNEDLADLLDKSEGLHVLNRIIERSKHNSTHPCVRNRDNASVVYKTLRDRLQKALLQFDINDITGFDPHSLEPPSTPSQHCSNCGQQNKKEMVICASCKHTLQKKFDYGSVTDAIVWAFVFNSIDLDLECQSKGRHCTLEMADVLRILPEARKYRELDELGEDFWKLESYFVTHFIYAMSDWGERPLRRELYMEEFKFLTSSLNYALQLDDPELVGEFIHCLFILGYSENDEATTKAIPHLKEVYIDSLRYLLATEKKLGSSGSWTSKASVAYARYHSAWCGVVGLMPHKQLGKPVAYLGNLSHPNPRFC